MATTTPPRSSIFALDKWPLLLALSLFGCPNENTGEDEVGGLPGGLVITEVMADPEGADDGLEWFEIHNASSEAIDLAGFDLIYSKLDGTGRKSHTIARSLTIEPGDFIVVSGVLDEIATQSDADHLDYGYGGELGSFTNAGGYLAIEASGEVIDEIYYQDATSGASRAFDGAFSPDAVANDDLTKWCDSRTEFEGPTFLASPGTANDLCSQQGCLENGAMREVVPAGPGDFVITEVHANPDIVDDALGEWFELHALADFDLNGLEIGKVVGDPADEAILLPECASVSNGEYVVIARSADPTANGGLPADAIRWITGISFKNTDGSLWMAAPDSEGVPGELIDAVTWTTAPTGATTQLDPDFEDPTANDQLGNWCDASLPYGDGDLGSPGEINEECAIEPPEGQCFDADTNQLRPIVPVTVGNLVITELLANPEGVADGDGEWFELWAKSSGDLNGMRVGKAGAWETKPIEWLGNFGDCVEVQPGDYVVVAHDQDPLVNCALPQVDGLFDMALNNSNSSLMVGFEVSGQIALWDEVTWASTVAGASTSFGGAPDSVANDDITAWCAGVGVYGCADEGTPGLANPSCGGGGGGDCIDPDTNMARAIVAPALGELVLSEVMPDPSAATDANGEWLEVYASASFDLNGLELGKDGAVKFTVVDPMCIEVTADSWLAFALEGDPLVNGGVDPVTLVYAGLSLTNDPGNVFIGYAGTLLDEYTWMNSPTGASLSRDLMADTWCAGVDPYGAGDLGTPALANPACGGGMMGGMCLDNGVPRAKVAPNLGDIVISEFMANPDVMGMVTDANGEWFELRALASFDLNGLEYGNSAFVMGAPADTTLSSNNCLAVSAGETVLFARNADSMVNGGLPPVDFTFSAGLTNSNAAMYIGHGGALLDQINWTASATGASTSLDPDFYAPDLNDTANNADPAWCYQTVVYGLGDKGTPDAANGQCP